MVRGVLLLTGATGRVGSALLPHLLARPEPVRCLVRDPRRLGADRVRVQLVLGDLADPASFRHALRGVATVVHLAASWRDQPRARLEELDGDAAAAARRGRRAGRRGALRAALAARRRAGAPAPRLPRQGGGGGGRAGLGDAFHGPARLGHPRRERPDGAAALAGRGDAPVQPIAAADVAACVLAALERPGVHELAGPQTMRWRTYARLLRGHRPLRVPPAAPAPHPARLRGRRRARRRRSPGTRRSGPPCR